MARDDYFVLVYRVLRYLYECVKAGEKPNAVNFTPNKLEIPLAYRDFIFMELEKEGYIQNLIIQESLEGTVLSNFDALQITASGIEYLQDHTKMKQAAELLASIKKAVPFL